MHHRRRFVTARERKLSLPPGEAGPAGEGGLVHALEAILASWGSCINYTVGRTTRGSVDVRRTQPFMGERMSFYPGRSAIQYPTALLFLAVGKMGKILGLAQGLSRE